VRIAGWFMKGMETVEMEGGRIWRLDAKMALAEQWLYERELARNNRSSSEQIDLARSAKKAAWTAAIAAIVSIAISLT
jgi:hypothetical protein